MWKGRNVGLLFYRKRQHGRQTEEAHALNTTRQRDAAERQRTPQFDRFADWVTATGIKTVEASRGRPTHLSFSRVMLVQAWEWEPLIFRTAAGYVGGNGCRRENAVEHCPQRPRRLLGRSGVTPFPVMSVLALLNQAETVKREPSGTGLFQVGG